MAAQLKYKKTYPQLIVDLMKQGYSQRAFAGHIGVSQQTVSDWINNYPEFAEAVEIGRSYRELYYEKVGLDLMVGKISKGSARVWELQSKNHFGLKDKVEIEADINGEMDVTHSIAIEFVSNNKESSTDE
jgi:transcriptional regulator with XRE-family HTH domain